MSRIRTRRNTLSATTRAPARRDGKPGRGISRDVLMVFSVAGIFVLAVVYSVLSATTIGDNISTGGTLSVSGNASFTNPVYASSTLQSTGNGLFYANLSAGASTNTPTATFNVTGSGYFTVGLGVGFATTGTGQLHVSDVAAFDDVIEVRSTNATSTFSGGVSFGGITTTNGLAVTSGILDANDILIRAETLGVGTSSPAQAFGVTGSGLFSGGLGVAYATTGTGHLRTTGLAVLGSRLGVNGTTSPYRDFGVTGDAALSSAATTTVSAESTGSTVGSCIELKGGNAQGGTPWVRIYVGGSGATNSPASGIPSAVIQTGGAGLLVIEAGRCQ